MRGISERSASKSSDKTLRLDFRKKKLDLVCFCSIATEISLHHSQVGASTSYVERESGWQALKSVVGFQLPFKISNAYIEVSMYAAMHSHLLENILIIFSSSMMNLL